MEQNSPRLEKLKQRHADLQLRIRREQQKLVRNERRRDTRRKIIAGAIALAEAEVDVKWKRKLFERLDASLNRESDRELFELPASLKEGSAPVRDQADHSKLFWSDLLRS